MKYAHSILPLMGALTLAGCPTPANDDDSVDIPEFPEVVNSEWLGDMSGTITYDKTYTSGDLEGTECTEVFTVTGSPLTTTPLECVACDKVYQVFVDRTEDCPGDDDMAEEGQAGFDMRQVEGEAVFWWFVEGGWFTDDDWTELGTGELSQDFTSSVLDFNFGFDDPQNDSVLGNNHFDIGDGCTPCSFNGTYTMDFDFSFTLPADWYQQQQQAAE